MSKQFSAVGQAVTRYSFLNSSGYAIGTGLTLPNGSFSGAGKVLGFNSINIPTPPARTVVVTGDNTFLGSVLIPGNTAAQGTWVTSMRNPTLANKSIGLVSETIGNTDFETFGTPCPVFTSMCIIGSAPGFDSNGNAGYETILWFNNQLFPAEEATITDSAAHQFTHNVKANPVTTRPWGKTLTVATNGTSKALGQKLFNTYPMTMWSITGDGATVLFTLDETPVADDGNTTIVYQAGVLLVYGAGAGKYQTVGTALTFGTAPGAGVSVVGFSFYNPVC